MNNSTNYIIHDVVSDRYVMSTFYNGFMYWMEVDANRVNGTDSFWRKHVEETFK